MTIKHELENVLASELSPNLKLRLIRLMVADMEEPLADWERELLEATSEPKAWRYYCTDCGDGLKVRNGLWYSIVNGSAACPRSRSGHRSSIALEGSNKRYC